MGNSILNLNWGFIDETFSPKFLPKLLKKAILEKKYKILQYGEADGLEELKKEVKNFLHLNLISNRINTSNLVITNGAIAALDLASRVILQRKYDCVVLEPTYDIALECLTYNSRKVHGIKFNDKGHITEKNWEKLGKLLSRKYVKLIYVIPNFNNPNGAVLSLPERKKLLELCKKNEVLIIEDDPYQIYNFSDARLPKNLIDLDVSLNHVIYITTISKLLYPGLRIGFLVTNKSLLSRITNLQRFSITSANLLSQAILLYAFKNGIVNKSIEYYRKKIKSKKNIIFRSIKDNELEKYAYLSPFFGGFFIWLRFGKRVNTTDLINQFSKLGITYVPGSVYFLKNDIHNYMRLAFGQINEVDIPEAIKRLGYGIKKIIADKPK